jgi:hypothetical protein
LKESKDLRLADPLITAFVERDLDVIAGAYSFFIQWGEPGSEDVLIQALRARGDEEMAEALLNCGNSVLEATARTWVTAGRYQIVSGPGTGGVRWGSRR